MFIHLLFGEGNTLLLNPDSKILHIISFINQKCGLDPKNLLELIPVDEANTFPMLYVQQPFDYLTPMVSERQFYIPAYIGLNNKGEITSLEPQLHNWREMFPLMRRRISIILNKKPLRTRGQSLSKEEPKRSSHSLRGSGLPRVANPRPTKKKYGRNLSPLNARTLP